MCNKITLSCWLILLHMQQDKGVTQDYKPTQLSTVSPALEGSCKAANNDIEARGPSAQRGCPVHQDTKLVSYCWMLQQGIQPHAGFATFLLTVSSDTDAGPTA